MKAFIKSLLPSITSTTEPAITPKVQILSDIHLEVGNQHTTYTFPAAAPFLLLGGDIGCLGPGYHAYLQFLQAQVARFERVFLVLGNHEFYKLTYEAGIEAARRLAAEPSIADKFTLLHRTRWDDPNSQLTILGCTLWSAVTDEQAETVQLAVNDFKRIEGWTVQKHCAVHAEEAAWLRSEVARMAASGEQPRRRILVATHHAPCFEGTSAPQYAKTAWSSAFATELIAAKAKQQWRGVRVWAFGHTHWSADFVRCGIRVVANQRGYVIPGEKPRGRKIEPKKGDKTSEFNAEFALSL